MEAAIDTKAKNRSRKFHEVFSQLALPEGIRENFSETQVEKIHIDKVAKSMDIYIRSEQIIGEEYLKDLNFIILEEFQGIEEINLYLKYYSATRDLQETVSAYWQNLLIHVRDRSPMCMKIMENAAWEVIDQVLLIKVVSSGSYLFLKKKLDQVIQQLFRERFDIQLSVKFMDETFDDHKRAQYMQKKSKDETSLIKQMIVRAPTDRDGEAEGMPHEKDSSRTNEAAVQPAAPRKRARSRIKINPDLSGMITKLDEELPVDDEIFIEGIIFSTELRETRSGLYIITFDITDRTNSVTVKFFIDPDHYGDSFKGLVKEGSAVCVYGKVQYDEFSKEINIMASEIGPNKVSGNQKRMDDAPEKRVELHLHTQMSAMDAVTTAKTYIKRAEEWGHKAIAITDHGVVQAFPEALEASRKSGVKVIYGVEAYFINDLGAVVQCPRDKTLDSEHVVFDIETTGLHKETDLIIEIGAVKMKGGQVVDRFSSFINPHVKLPDKIIELTGITDAMLVDQPEETDVIKEFLAFIGDNVLVAHNASFDVGFISLAAKRQFSLEVNNTVLDTVELARTLFPELSKHKLDHVAAHLGVQLDNHHRAVDDAEATAEIYMKCVDILKDKGLHSLQDINVLASQSINKTKLKPYHAVILVQNYTGLRNLYELVSMAHIDYFYRRPRIPKSEYLRLQEGLIIGTACEAGEFYKAVKDNKPDDYIRELAEFYDYLEIQPVDNNMFMLRDGEVGSVQELIDINKKIVAYGEKYQKPVVATCDVHFIDPEDEIYRRIIMAGDGFKDADNQAPLFYRTTEEMLDEFNYLGPEKAREVVIENTNKIADMVEDIKPIPDETFPPEIEGADEEIKAITTSKAIELYGDPLPSIVQDRLDRELGSIIKNGFSVMYLIAQKLVSKSLEDGYLVGSRGSVGSSLVATMSDITEVNPLPPHYRCPSCRHSEFDTEDVLRFIKENPGGSGCDMPDKNCPVCGAVLYKDGHDIPFETFLGFDGDKEPDIDLNFSGEYQAKAHAYTEELFGSDHVFKAGTIGTLADKTAFGYVKNYMEDRGIKARKAEINRIKLGCIGVKRTTGQHPGGLMVVPNNHSIYEFCPIQRPANDMKSTVTTTHFDYHSISGRLLKLDLLGHDVPTIIRMLHDSTGIDPRQVPLSDKKVINLFISPAPMNVSPEDIDCKTGSLGLPEFGTSIVRQMLLDTQPSTFGELVRISGLAHGTDVWFNNAQELIKNKTCSLKEVIPTRDDIMIYLIAHGVEKKKSFKIMESVRKGKGLTEEDEKIMLENNVPQWYVDSCKKIKYMFPKGHAVAYVMMTVRIGYFKLYHPYSFYAATLSVKYDDFDYETMCKGKEIVKEEMKRIRSLDYDATAKDKTMLTTLEIVNEMYARGLKFLPLNLYEAETTKFKATPNGLMPPLCSIQGLGETVAQNIVEARKDGEFMTIEEFRERTKATKTVIDLLKKNKVLDGIPETNQLTLF